MRLDMQKNMSVSPSGILFLREKRSLASLATDMRLVQVETGLRQRSFKSSFPVNSDSCVPTLVRQDRSLVMESVFLKPADTES